MRSDLDENTRQLAALRKRAGELTIRIRQDTDLLAEVHHRLAELLNEVVHECAAQPRAGSPLSRPTGPIAASSVTNVGVDAKGPRLLRIDEVAMCLGLSRSQVWRMVKECRFPKPRRLSTRAVAWLEQEVSGWISARPVFDSPGQPAPRARR